MMWNPQSALSKAKWFRVELIAQITCCNPPQPYVLYYLVLTPVWMQGNLPRGAVQQKRGKEITYSITYRPERCLWGAHFLENGVTWLCWKSKSKWNFLSLYGMTSVSARLHGLMVALCQIGDLSRPLPCLSPNGSQVGFSQYNFSIARSL